MVTSNSAGGTSLDFSRLTQLRESSKSDVGGTTKEVAQQFESLFVNMMLQAMRKATNKSGLLDSQATQTYEQLFDQEVATSLSKTGSFGIAEAIERQIRFSKGSEQHLNRSETDNSNDSRSFLLNDWTRNSFSFPSKSSFQLYEDKE